MKIAILHGPGDLRIEERPLVTDALAPDEVWVQTEISALKPGTDRCNYEGAEAVPGAPPFPRPVGDSNLGRVCGVGRDVSRFRVGDRVLATMPHQSEYVARESDSLVHVPDSLNPEDAVFGHLLALAGHCYRKARFEPGENVAVVGLGVIGVGAVALGRLCGARVMAIGNHALRLDAARRMGAQTVALWDDDDLAAEREAFGGSGGIDLVILTANGWDAYRTALESVRPGGRVAIVSLVGRGEPPAPFNPLAMEWFYEKGISLIAVNGPAGRSFPAADGLGAWERGCRQVLALVEEGRLEPKRLVTHRFHFSEIPDAYALAARREKSMLGVVFDWSGVC